MYPVSDAWKDEIRKSHRPYWRGEVWSRGEFLMELPIVGGSVSIDETADVRRRSNLTLADPLSSLVPQSATDPLWPKYNEVWLYSGIKFRGGSTEEVPMGKFRISKPKVSDRVGKAGLTIQLYDRARAAKRARLQKSVAIPNGTNVAVAIKSLIQLALPFLDDSMFNLMVTSRTTPLILLAHTADPWAEAMKLAESIGAEVFFDSAGLVVLRPILDPNTVQPVWDYRGDATFLGADREVDEEAAYNMWICVGEGPDIVAPFYVVVTDDNPESPTYLDPDDPWATAVPYFVAPGFVKDESQGIEAVLAARMRSTGFVENVSITAITNVAHEAGDVVAIERERSRTSGAYVFSKIQYTIGKSAMAVTTRRRARIA